MKVATSVRLEITMSVRQSVTSITSLSLVGVTAAVSTADFHEYTSYMHPFTCAVHARLVRNSILPYLISPYERDTTPTPVPSDSLLSFNPAMLARNIRLKVSTVDRLSPNEIFPNHRFIMLLPQQYISIYDLPNSLYQSYIFE